MKTAGWQKEQKNRQNCYSLLGACFYLPDEKLIESLEKLTGLIIGPVAKLTELSLDSEKMEELKVDFSRLFVGPFKLLAPPYGSIYLEEGQRLMQDSTIDVRRRYREQGLDIRLKDAPDHIAFELEFMYFLISKQLLAMDSADINLQNKYVQIQKSFLSEHLGLWIPKFTARVSEFAKTDFYKELAIITQNFIAEEIKSFEDN